MLKRQMSTQKLPKLATNEQTASSKLFSLTGVRMFRAKFMQELNNPKPVPAPKKITIENLESTNQSSIVVSPSTFTGKDRNNQSQNTDVPLTPSKITIHEKPQTAKKKEKVKCGRPRGLQNLGNTCYMNAVLQTLFSLEEFNTALQVQHPSSSYKNILGSYLRLIKSVRHSSDRDIINPSELKKYMGVKNTRFAGTSQQDAQQFLTAFLEAINQQSTRIKTKPKYQQLNGDPSKQSISKIADNWWQYFMTRDNSPVCDFFQGQIHSSITCGDCKHSSVSFDTYWGMPVSLDRKSTSLLQLLNKSYCTQQILSDYNCQKCKRPTTCKKKTSVYRFPHYLVIQLKRFGFGFSSKQKIKDRIDAPLQLNLKSIISESAITQKMPKFRLKSTVQHSGELNYGHYTGHVFSQKDQKWFLANDQSIQPDQIDLGSPKLYMLVYEQV